jgi:hypothetical protein
MSLSVRVHACGLSYSKKESESQVKSMLLGSTLSFVQKGINPQFMRTTSEGLSLVMIGIEGNVKAQALYAG